MLNPAAMNPAPKNAIQNKAQDFAQASTKYASYIVTNCVAGNLPSGVTIPKIPGQ